MTKALRRAYYAAVSFTDYNIGRVLEALEQHGFENNTVVSFWGDHGWQLGEHGEWCKHTNFDLATNAPMIVHVPGKTDAGIVSSTPTEYLDLMPTLAEAAMGYEVPACPSDAQAARQVPLCTHGTSLLPLVDAPDTPVKPAAYSQYPRSYQKPGTEGQFVEELASVRAGTTALSTGTQSRFIWIIDWCVPSISWESNSTLFVRFSVTFAGGSTSTQRIRAPRIGTGWWARSSTTTVAIRWRTSTLPRPPTRRWSVHSLLCSTNTQWRARHSTAGTQNVKTITSYDTRYDTGY